MAARRELISQLIVVNRSTPQEVMNDYVLARYKPLIDVIARDNLTPKQAAIALGVAAPPSWVVSTPQFQQAVTRERESWQRAYDITRRDVVEGIKSGIELARTIGDASTVVRGWTEIGKLCGLAAPQQVEVKAQINHDVTIRDLQRLSDAELLALITPQNGNVIEGEVINDNQ